MVPLIFTEIERHPVVAELTRAAAAKDAPKDEVEGMIRSVVSGIVDEAERFSLSGDLWNLFFALRLAEGENALGRACELTGPPRGSLADIAPAELWRLLETLRSTRDLARSRVSSFDCRFMECYVPSGRSASFSPEVSDALSLLASRIGEARTPEALMTAAVAFYRSMGSGLFGLYRAFHWSGDALAPVADVDPQTLGALIGYEEQKDALLANTRLFVSGEPANNVLLFGDSGTGKSSSVKALLNESELVRGGLRMIEVRKGRYGDLPDIVNATRGRNYRFILFLDDLSFEEFEVEYKYLKAVIEGGLERKPDNVVVYATSNRRNLVREVWSDRKAASDDVHGGDTMQERHSLADRFGTTIWYGCVGKDRYMDMVRALARARGIDMPEKELEGLALRWELGRGAFTGRAARQFVFHLSTDRHFGGRTASEARRRDDESIRREG